MNYGTLPDDWLSANNYYPSLKKNDRANVSNYTGLFHSLHACNLLYKVLDGTHNLSLSYETPEPA